MHVYHVHILALLVHSSQSDDESVMCRVVATFGQYRPKLCYSFTVSKMSQLSVVS